MKVESTPGIAVRLPISDPKPQIAPSAKARLYAAWLSYEDNRDGATKRERSEFCIAGMDGSVWVDDEGLAAAIAHVDRMGPINTDNTAFAFEVRLLSIALESGKLHRVSREEAEAIAEEWGARWVAERGKGA